MLEIWAEHQAWRQEIKFNPFMSGVCELSDNVTHESWKKEIFE